MSAKSESIVKSLLESIKSPSKETQPYDTSATVTRVEDDTVFVHIPGGVAETPCSKTINCKVGDTVQVRVGGGKAWLVGNASAPPTDDTMANTAIRRTNQLGDSLTKLQKIAGNTDQYFWHVETGEDTGSHITEIPKERFLESPELGGGNLLLRSNGIAIRNGLNELATFSGSAIQFNQPGTSTVVATIGTSGLYIQKGVIKLGNKTSASDTTNSGTYIDANGNMATSNILATGGEIGGWTINATSLARTFTITNGTQTTSLTNAGINFVRTVSGTQYISSYSADSFAVYGTDGSRVVGSTSLISLMSSSGNCAIYSTLINMDVNNVGTLYLTGNTIRTTYNAALAEMTPGQIKVQSGNNYTIVGSNNVQVNNASGAAVHVITGSYNIALHANTAGNRGIYDSGLGRWILYHDSSGNLLMGHPNAPITRMHGRQTQLMNTQNAYVRFFYDDNEHHVFQPSSNNLMWMGTPTLRWAHVYCTDAAWNGSDLKEKSVIEDFDWKVDEFISGLKPIAFKRIWDDGSTSTRIRLGFGAQDVAKLSKDLNMGDLCMYNAVIVDEDKDGNKIERDYHGEEIDDSKLSWSLGYTELIAPMVLEIQQLMNRVSELEARLNG